MGVIFFDFFVKFRFIKLSVAFVFVIFCIENDYAFPLSAGFITMSVLEMSFWRASLSCLERLSAIFDGLVLRTSLLSNGKRALIQGLGLYSGSRNLSF